MERVYGCTGIYLGLVFRPYGSAWWTAEDRRACARRFPSHDDALEWLTDQERTEEAA